MSAPSLQQIQAKLFNQQPLSAEEQQAWHAHLQTNGTGGKPGTMGNTPPKRRLLGPQSRNSQNTYQTPKLGQSEGEEELRQRNFFAPPGARVGTTGGLLPDQGDAAPAAPAPISPFEAGQRDRADGDAYYNGFSGTKPGAAPGKTAPAPAPQAHSNIGARDPKARKPGAGQGTITVHRRDDAGNKTGVNNVFGYDSGSAVKNEDGSKRDFGTTAAAMDHLDAARAPAMPSPAAAPAPAAPAAAPMPMGGAGGHYGPVEMVNDPTAPATPPNAPLPVMGTPTSAGANIFGGPNILTGRFPMPQAQQPALPSAAAVAAAPAPAAQPATPAGYPAIPSPLPMDGQPAASVSPAVRDAFKPVHKPDVPGMTHTLGQGKPVPGWAQNGLPAAPSAPSAPMFPKAIWNTPMADAAQLAGKKSKPFQAAASQFNPFDEKRRVLPE